MSKKKKTQKEIPEPTPEEILAFPNWNEDNRIYNYIQVEKNIEGKKHEFIVKSWEENGTILYEIDNSICLPPNTPMSYECFQTIRDTGKLPTVSIKELFHELKERQSQYVYAEDIHLTNITLKSIASFFLEVFHTVPYSDIFSPEYGSGKTTLMEVAVWSSYHGIVNTDPTAAVLYRIMEDVRCTIGIDEVDNLFKIKNANPNIIAIVNSSNVKGIPVLRINMEKGGKVEPFDAYGPKFFTRVGTNIPPAWVSRADPIPMIENRGRKYLKKYPSAKAFQDLRDTGYILRWTMMEKVQETYQKLIDNRVLVDRNGDIYLPILTIAKLVEEENYQEVLSYAEEQWKKSSLRSKDIYKEILVRVLWQEKDFRNEVKVIDIRNAYNEHLKAEGLLGKNREGNYKDYNSRSVISLLESLQFERSPKRSGNNVHYNINPEKLEEIIQIYDIKKKASSEESEESEDPYPRKESKIDAFLPKRTSQSSQTSLNDLTPIDKIGFLIDKWIEESEEGWINIKPTIKSLVQKGYNQKLSKKVIEEGTRRGAYFEVQPGRISKPELSERHYPEEVTE